MTTIASAYSANRNSLLRSIAIAGMIITILQLIHMWIIATLLEKVPYMVALQYIASGGLGDAAFEGGITTALVGLIFHVIISYAIVTVFILSVDRIPLLRRYLIPGALLYGFGVWFVMNWIVTPLSAAPPLDPPAMPKMIEAILEHIVVIGLTVGMVVRRNTSPSK